MSKQFETTPSEADKDEDDFNYLKHLAYQRFVENNVLMNEIFSDSIVPDEHFFVHTEWMQALKRQVSVLTEKQSNLEAGIQQMEDKFEAKKQRMMESNAAFQEELKRLCRPAVNEETVQKMAQRMYEDLKRDPQRLEEPAVHPHVPISSSSIKPLDVVPEISEENSICTSPKELTASKRTETQTPTEFVRDGKIDPEPAYSGFRI